MFKNRQAVVEFVQKLDHDTRDSLFTMLSEFGARVREEAFELMAQKHRYCDTVLSVTRLPAGFVPWRGVPHGEIALIMGHTGRHRTKIATTMPSSIVEIASKHQAGVHSPFSVELKPVTVKEYRKIFAPKYCREDYEEVDELRMSYKK